MTEVMVLGAGVVGVTTAWYLRAEGFDVTVVDRRPLPACETSYANGGQISVSHAVPWANPAAPWKILPWLFRDDAPLLFRPRMDPAQWAWCAQFLTECLPGRTARNVAANVALGLYSRESLSELTEALGLEYARQKRGILQVYSNEHALRASVKSVALMRAHGCELRTVGPEEVRAIEPALRFTNHPIAGATWAEADYSGDAKAFTRGLAAKAEEAGVSFRFGTEIVRLDEENGAVSGVTLRDAEGGFEKIRADFYVMALGPQAREMMQGVGVSLPIYPAKGYSITMPITDEARAPHASVSDDAQKIAITRLGGFLRAAGTAELAGYGRQLNPVRVEAILNRVLELFPGVGDRALARAWSGLRPSTPANVPIIGRSGVGKLFLNTGHGTLGWTHACGSARALAAIMSGKPAPIAFPFQS